MKTSVEIADALLARTRRVARAEHTTMRQLVEEGLTLAVARRDRPRAVKIAPVTFKGEGLAPMYRVGGWAATHAAIYDGRAYPLMPA